MILKTYRSNKMTSEHFDNNMMKSLKNEAVIEHSTELVKRLLTALRIWAEKNDKDMILLDTSLTEILLTLQSAGLDKETKK